MWGSIWSRPLTVFLMHSLNLVIERADTPDGKVYLIQTGHGGQAGPREFAEWVKMKTIDERDQAVGQDTTEEEASD